MDGTITDVVQITGTLSEVESVSGNLSVVETISGTVTVPTVIRPDYYEGDYEITPTSTTVVLETNSLIMNGNITVNPIPTNYGLITWNGATLTVS